MFYKNQGHKDNNEAFLKVMKEFSCNYYCPQPDKAPWHYRIRINGMELNAWPHLAKFGYDRSPTVIGTKNLRVMLTEAQSDDWNPILIDDGDMYIA